MAAISIFVREAGILSATAIPLGISDLTIGIIVALVFGSVLFVVKCGRQCCDNVKWIIEICKMNYCKKTEELEIKGKETKEKKKTETSVEEIDKEQIAEIKEEISELSQQVKGILAEIKQIRKTEALNAIEDDIQRASTEYAMKFELKRIEYDQAMKILQVELSNMPDQAIAYKMKVNDWISKAHKKFRKYSPEHFHKKVESLRAKRKGKK